MILISAIIFAVFSVLSAIAPNNGSYYLIIMRIFLGLAVGAASALVPAYISELAPAAIRGRLSGLNQTMIVSGMLISYIVDYILKGLPNQIAWRLMLGFACIPAIDPDAGVKTRSTYLERVTKVTNALNALGFQAKLPQGAFYVWAKIPDKFGDDADNFCLDLAQRARVQIFPGSIFSDTAKNYVRISCAGSDARLDSALRRITDYLQNC